MYVWGRLTRVMATLGTRGTLEPGGQNRLAFRCLPSDIDPNRHMNNARYLMLADLGRFDLFFRSGLMRLCRERNWTLLMGGVQASYLREIRLWQKFAVRSALDAWSGTQILARHRFELADGEPAAIVLASAGVYDRSAKAFVPIDVVAAALRTWAPASRPLTEAEGHFLAANAALRREAGKTGKTPAPLDRSPDRR